MPLKRCGQSPHLKHDRFRLCLRTHLQSPSHRRSIKGSPNSRAYRLTPSLRNSLQRFSVLTRSYSRVLRQPILYVHHNSLIGIVLRSWFVEGQTLGSTDGIYQFEVCSGQNVDWSGDRLWTRGTEAVAESGYWGLEMYYSTAIIAAPGATTRRSESECALAGGTGRTVAVALGSGVS